MNEKRIRLAIAGGNRGKAFNSTLSLLADVVELTAICDVDGERIAEWQKSFPGIEGYVSFDEMLEKSDIDAVFVATPIELHYEQTKKALLAGRHVLCEVYAANTLEEMADLVRLVESTGLVYMMAENYVYMRQNMMVLNMVQQGAFGDITYAEGGYVHDCRPIRVDSSGHCTWRGEQMRRQRGNLYPTHSLGPVAKWLGLTERDEMKRCSTFVSKHASMDNYISQRFGADHEAMKKGYWAYGDTVTTVIECESEALVVLRFDGDSMRPHNMVHYELQGTRASYLSGRHDDEDPLVWVDGVSSVRPDGTAEKWDDLYKHAYKYEHPLWVEHMADARRLGHGGGDFFVLRDFLSAIRNGTRPFIDIYDAVAWSSIVPVSIESVKKGGIPIDIPRFPRKAR
jgi:predicted dehydrogenase